MSENIKWWQTLNEVLNGIQDMKYGVWTNSSPDIRRGLELTNNTLESIKAYDEEKNYEAIYYLVYCEVAHAYTLSEDMDGCFDADLRCAKREFARHLSELKKFNKLFTDEYLRIKNEYGL